MRRLFAFAVLCLSLLVTGPVLANRSTGVFMLVEEVQFGPNARQPEWIKIRGVFLNEWEDAASPDMRLFESAESKVIKAGWIYFGLPQASAAHARAEWEEIAELATKNKEALRTNGTTAIVALGSAYTEYFTARISEKIPSTEPQTYPIDHGLYVIRNNSKPAKLLLEFWRATNAARK
jgi:hypothetical protein